MTHLAVNRLTLAALALGLLPHLAFAVDLPGVASPTAGAPATVTRWGIPAGQEALLERALATTPTWPKGWTFTGASIDHGVIDARYKNPDGLGLGVRLQHPQYVGGPRQAGQFEIASVSAELPDAVLKQIKLQLEKVPEFRWTPLHDRDGDAVDAPAAATLTVQAQGEALIAAGKALELLGLLKDGPQPCATRQAWVMRMADANSADLYPLAEDIAQRTPACPEAQLAVARWSATLGKPAQGEAILRGVLKSGDNALVQAELALLLRQQQRCGEALAVLAKTDYAKVPKIAQELARLSRVYIDCHDDAVLAAMQQRADGAKPDLVAAFIVGSILHHDGKWRESDVYLKRAEPLMHEEPREYLYQAMNAFHDGRQADAEALVTRAAAMHSEDPDVLYCRAMIFAEVKIGQAIADLQAYDKAMAGTLDKTPGKQAHVAEVLTELQACQSAADVHQCRELRRASHVAVRWLPPLVVLALGVFALLRWRRRR